MDIGVDITKISRFANKDEHFIRRILGESEIKEYLSLSDEKKITYLASHFALKEALFKASQDQHYLKYQFLHDEKGKLYCLNHPEIKVSLSHDNDLAIAFIVKMD